MTIGGYSVFEEPAKAKALIGYLPEQPPLYLDMTCEEYLYFVMGAKRVPRDQWREQLEYAMGRTGIGDVRHRLLRNLSKGYRQRVGLAQALIGHPQVVILDEPTVGLDPAQIIEIRQLVRELGREHTVLFSSHILSEVNAVCDSILILSRGKLVASDTPENLEKLLGGAATIELVARAPRRAIEALLRQHPEWGAPTFSEHAGEEGVQVTLSGEGDPREALFMLLPRRTCHCRDATRPRQLGRRVLGTHRAGGDGNAGGWKGGPGGMTAVFRREMGAYFHGVTGYLFMAFVLVFAGIYTMVYNLQVCMRILNTYWTPSASFISSLCRFSPCARWRKKAAAHGSAIVFLAHPLGRRGSGQIPGHVNSACGANGGDGAISLLLSRFGSVYLPTAYASLLAFFCWGLRCWPLVCSFLRFRRARWAAPWFAWPPCCSYFFCPRWPAMCLPRQAHRSSR